MNQMRRAPWWLGPVNFVIVQWAFLRLAVVVYEDGSRGWAILRWVVPLTGWWSGYRWFRR